MARCSYVKPNGDGCCANALSGGTFCFFHDPSKATDRAIARSAGGKRNQVVVPCDVPPRPLETTQDVAALLAETINQVRCGELDPKVANAVGYLSNLLLKAIEQDEIQAQLAMFATILRPPDVAIVADDDLSMSHLVEKSGE